MIIFGDHFYAVSARKRPKNRGNKHARPLDNWLAVTIYCALQKDHPEIYQTLTPQQRYVLTPAKQWNVQLQHAGNGKTALRYLARREVSRLPAIALATAGSHSSWDKTNWGAKLARLNDETHGTNHPVKG